MQVMGELLIGASSNLPQALLPDALKDGNPLGIWRLVDDEVPRK